MRVVGVDVLVLYDVVFGALDDLCIAGMLVGHMAVQASRHLNQARCCGPTDNGLLMYLLQCFQVIMAIQTDQTLLGMVIGQQVGILQGLHMRDQVTESTVRIGAPRSHFHVADLARHVQIALLVALHTGRHRNDHFARDGIIPVPHGSMAIPARQVLRRTVNNRVVRREQIVICILVRQLAVA